jgi:hypothetical protein
MVDVSDRNLDENVIFISWKQFETETLVILMQYKHKFIKCRHYKPHLQLQKLVMYSCQQQSFGIIDGFFRSTTQANNHIKLNRSFNLQVNQSVSLRTFQCLYCNTRITLTCDTLQKTVNVSGSEGSKLIFSDSHLVNGWKESSFSNCGTQELSNCNLTIQTLLQSTNLVNHFWIIAQGKLFQILYFPCVQLVAKKTGKDNFPNVNLSLNFDNKLISRKKVSHYEKIVKMCQFYSDSSRFFATNCECSVRKFN